MAIKEQNTDALADFLAKGGKITKCATKTSQPPSLYALERRAERNADNGFGYGVKRSSLNDSKLNVDALPEHLRKLVTPSN